MSEINIMDTTIPALSLDVVENEIACLPLEQQLSPKDKEAFRKEQFTENELQQISDFSKTIDLHDTNSVITYGAGAQKRLSEFSDIVLDNCRNKDMGEIGGMLSGFVAELKAPAEDDKKGFLGLFKKSENKIETMKAHYRKIEDNMEVVVKTLEDNQNTLMRDIATMDQLFDKNKAYFKELTMYIAAGKLALDNANNVELPALKARAAETGLTEDAQSANDYGSMCERFEKRIYDLELTREICLQNAPQIRVIQNNAVVMSDRIQSAIVNVIPLWKNQMVLALGNAHAQEAVKAQKAVSDATNEMLRRNAEMLHQTSVDIATENERGIVDIETLQYTNEQLIATLDDIVKIQDEGKAKRAAAETELLKMENNLKNKLIEVTTR